MPYIYFIHEEGCDNCFKMGKTANHPVDRLKQLQTGNPRRLLVYKYVKVDDHSSVEEYLHCKFVELRVQGEWFNISKSVIDEECETILGNLEEAQVSGDYERATWEQRQQIKINNARKKLEKANKPLTGYVGFSDDLRFSN